VIPAHPLLEPVRALHRQIRKAVRRVCQKSSVETLAAVAEDGEGDTIYAVDKVSEAVLIEGLEAAAAQAGGLVLVAEGIAGGRVTLPRGRAEADCRYRALVDPIDGTRGLMYQKRPAWVLTGVAPNRGRDTRLSDIELAVQTELPLVKQHLADELWAVRGAGARAERMNLDSGSRSELGLVPSRATTILHGYAMVSRFFPGIREELAAIDEEIIRDLLGPAPAGKALCFEDQYASTGGQLYELMVGHDRFVADLRPLLAPLLQARGLPLSLCCHPYDVCTALIAEELGVVVRSPSGGPLDAPFDIDADVAWAGYANPELARSIEPLLRAALARRGLAT
jgi:fructose-1,6-bisphosphatase/inositol monophosphatase family enzyme